MSWSYDELEDIARKSVVAGGVTAMAYYRDAIGSANTLDQASNASTEADIQATLAILRTLHPLLSEIDEHYIVYGEELDASVGNDAVRERMSEEINRLEDSQKACIVRDASEFIEQFPGRICVLIDALDGTTNFRAGLPLFCSALAMFVDRTLRVGAIYDPIHHVVFYGSNRDPDMSRAMCWHVLTGSNSELFPRPNEMFLVASHLTRGSKDKSPSRARKRIDMIKKLEELADTATGTYLINSGQLALAYVASGNLSAFVTNNTNIWDVAAGEVLVSAVGGKVTDFQQRKFTYDSVAKVQVVASGSHAIHRRVFKKLK